MDLRPLSPFLNWAAALIFAKRISASVGIGLSTGIPIGITASMGTGFAAAGVFLLASGLSSPAVAQASKPLDAIAVVVNGQALTQLDLERKKQFFLATLKSNNQAGPDDATLSSVMVERAVMETLLLQAAAKQGLTPSAALVQQAIADNALQAGLDVEQYIQRVEQAGISADDYRASVANDIAISNVRDRNMGSKITVTDNEIERFLREPQSGIAQEYSASVLFIDKPEGASEAELSQRSALAQSLRAQALQIRDAQAFSALQAQVNNLTQTQGLRSNQGQGQAQNQTTQHVVDLGFKTLDKLPELYSVALEKMSTGQTAPLLESSAGFYILRLVNKRTVLPKVSQTMARHILLRTDKEADEKKIETQIKSLYDRIVINPDSFAALAQEYSQDGSASKGGELGWALPGDMVPEFERVMDSLKPGELALPLRSQFGWHIVQVLDRKMADLPMERLRARAKQAVRARKQEQAMGEWLDQLRAQAYIEYKEGYKP